MPSKSLVRRNRDTLKRKFGDGEMPSATAFADLIDSMLNIVDEGFDKTAEDGLKVAQLSQGKLLSFYQNIDVKSPIWSIRLDGPEGSLSFGNGSNDRVLNLRELKAERDGEARTAEYELDLAGRIVADGRRGRAGRLSVPADGKWHNITDTLTGCNAFEITAGVGKPGSGKYALMHAFTMIAFNGKSEIDYRQAHFGSRCNRLQLQWVPDPQGARHAYVLQMRVGCSYDDRRNPKDKTWVSYYITNLWFDPLMEACAQDPEAKVKS
ncbi:MAG TPA: hypothetical protein VL598_14775 [Trinickia sp.]|jgi:hypothetical protein|uniref:hypothetical protein n=1 Tax=Trinickia sp. TaxID=2571163 RepID=UPI002C502614|nr:hypothetical protein [Trinickia sp.]HTI18922.1 hypothetical protein [Trinickia sp.]